MEKTLQNSLLAAAAFMAGMLAWPDGQTASVLPGMFIAHGVLAWRFSAAQRRDSWCLAAAGALYAWLTMPLTLAVAWGASLCLPLLVLHYTLPGPHFRLYASLGIERLIVRMFLPALLGSSSLGLLGALPLPQWIGCFCLMWMTLTLFTGMQYVPKQSRDMTRHTIWAAALMISGSVGLVLLPSSADLLSISFWLLPLLVFAAPRYGTIGLTILSSVALLLLSFGVMAGFPDWELLQGMKASLSIALICVLLGGVAVMGDLYRRRERLLRDVRAQFESLLNQSVSLMTLKNTDGSYLLVNLNFARMFGLPAEYFKGKSSADVLAPQEAALINLHDQQVMASLESRQYEQRISVGDKNYLMLSSVFPLFDSDGLPAGVGSISVDISQREEEERQRHEAVEKYRAVVEQSLVGIYIVQGEQLAYVNPKLADLVGTKAESLIGQEVGVILPPGEDERIRQQIRKRMRENIRIMHYTTRLQRQTGEAVDVEVHSRLIEYNGSKAIIGMVVDISDRVTANAELRLAATVFENATEGILVTDSAGAVVMVNEAFTRITGFSAEEAIGRTSRMLKTANRERNKALIESLHGMGFWKGEMLDRRKCGEAYTAELSISAVKDSHGRLTHYVGVFSDITGRKQAEDRLQFLATHDPLTRLPNRSALLETIDSAIISSGDAMPKLALMFIDLDRFKLINDSFGHQAGDEVLHEIASRLSQAVERFGVVARLGGDEFTLVVEDFDSHEALARMAEEVLHTLARPIRIETHEVFVSGSIGISVYPNDGIDAASLLKNADSAMYRAKESGKNTYQFFDAQMNAQTFERLLMESGLRQALERGEFELHYQPQVAGDDHQMMGVEALIRWRHPQLGMISPASFIPLAEETGLIKPIGAWVLREACRQMVAWDAEGIAIPRIAVNLSARQFEQQSLLRDVTSVLERYALAPARLELEITESMLMQNPHEAVMLLGELKALGVKLSIDDFGTGYSSLSTLKRFPLDYLKVDRSFIEGLPGDSDSAAITEAIIAMARKLNFTVIAEGVETAEQGAFLRRNGCAILQGYYFSKPLPAANLALWVTRHRQRCLEGVT